ncbi:hypothetical protein FIBSPDRAFT_182069 [Athelia psychrophila]|uniref:Uncharacterized protein n=1 Tax=Athelia psychrophila TaxID=1759441 RepID=A0A166AG99_9AGAM|nr:hypothetical protein FIBSPDRAFT_182069 [Fibularhizoctonia sp. CBS 109695]
MMAALEEEEEANRASSSFDTRQVSRGATVYNINGNCIIHTHVNPMPGSTPHEAIHSQTLKRIHAASSTLTLSVAQLPRPSQPPNNQITTTSATVDYDSATRSIDQLHVMIGIVQTIMANPTLCSSQNLPETLAALKRVLTLMELALRAYRHTDLVHSLSSTISIGVDECRPLLDELITNLTSSRHVLSDTVLRFIRKYIWASAGQGSAVHALDTKLRKSHSSFAACLLALGR